MVPLDKELQWVNVKQNPFRQIYAHLGTIKPRATLGCLELPYNQNSGIFRTQAFFLFFFLFEQITHLHIELTKKLKTKKSITTDVKVPDVKSYKRLRYKYK